MAIKRVKETEKVTVGVLRTALQTWLAPEFSTLSDRLTHVEARLDGIDRRLDGIDRRLDGIDKRLDGIDKRLDGMDKRFDAVEMRVASLEKQVEVQGKRIDSLEKRMEESITSFRNEMRSEFATVHGEIRHLQQITDARERLASVEAKLAAQHG
jgi:chromosome segregation ATPase